LTRRENADEVRSISTNRINIQRASFWDCTLSRAFCSAGRTSHVLSRTQRDKSEDDKEKSDGKFSEGHW